MEGDVEALEWLMQLFDGKGLRWRDGGMGLSQLAARRGKIESLTYLYANGCHWNESTCFGAALLEGTTGGTSVGAPERVPLEQVDVPWRGEGGFLEVLQWARQNGCPWDESTCFGAAKGGFLEVLQWALERVPAWNVWTCTFGAEGRTSGGT